MGPHDCVPGMAARVPADVSGKGEAHLRRVSRRQTLHPFRSY